MCTYVLLDVLLHALILNSCDENRSDFDLSPTWCCCSMISPS